VNRLARIPDVLAAWLLRHARLLGDPESVVATLIITVWTVLAGMSSGWIGVLVFTGIGWLLHGVAVESGNHVALWGASAFLLVSILAASGLTFDDFPPVVLTAAGASALAHNELVRLNHARRRRATIDDSVFQASGLAVTLSGLVAVVAVAMADALGRGPERPWTWMPVAVGALMLVGLALAVVPTRHASVGSRQRWRPGERIPPQPLGRDDAQPF